MLESPPVLRHFTAKLEPLMSDLVANDSPILA